MTCDAISPITSSSPCPGKTRAVFSNESPSVYALTKICIKPIVARHCCPSEPGNGKKHKKNSFLFPKSSACASLRRLPIAEIVLLRQLSRWIAVAGVGSNDTGGGGRLVSDTPRDPRKAPVKPVGQQTGFYEGLVVLLRVRKVVRVWRQKTEDTWNRKKISDGTYESRGRSQNEFIYEGRV